MSAGRPCHAKKSMLSRPRRPHPLPVSVHYRRQQNPGPRRNPSQAAARHRPGRFLLSVSSFIFASLDFIVVVQLWLFAFVASIELVVMRLSLVLLSWLALSLRCCVVLSSPGCLVVGCRLPSSGGQIDEWRPYTLRLGDGAVAFSFVFIISRKG